MVFFFQAEDGIRDLVRSRGLGDVYKRQVIKGYFTNRTAFQNETEKSNDRFGTFGRNGGLEPVSYTHLTLPTSDLV